ncbi:MAG: hypothetical protein AAF456_18330, partial [Planctomycetota bacterium]
MKYSRMILLCLIALATLSADSPAQVVDLAPEFSNIVENNGDQPVEPNIRIDDVVNGITVGASGRIYTAGFTKPNPFPPLIVQLCEFSPTNGNETPVCVEQESDLPGEDAEARDICSGRNGLVFYVGNVSGGALPGGTDAGPLSDGFIGCFQEADFGMAPHNVVQWRTADRSTIATGVAADGKGSVYVTGWNGSPNINDEDIYLRRYNESLELQWETVIES